MDEKAMGFNESQLKRTGFAEAFTPDLKSKMEQGLPVIQHEFKKSYEGDEVMATLHLKKSITSDYYFLNKFDLQLQRDGQTDNVKQTFYINSRKGSNGEDGEKQKQDVKYTLKEGYNLLAGRPVYKTLFNNQGDQYNAWVKLDFKNKLDSGNHEMKQYTKNYGFELENVLSKYPIKELTNEQYKQSLIDSLQRGNLQKATFVGKDGNEEKLYVTPNIVLGALNVYDENKQRLSTQDLVDKQYIGKEMADQLKQHVIQKNKEGEKEKPAIPSQKKDQKQKQGQKVGSDDSKKKPARKQKVH